MTTNGHASRFPSALPWLPSTTKRVWIGCEEKPGPNDARCVVWAHKCVFNLLIYLFIHYYDTQGPTTTPSAHLTSLAFKREPGVHHTVRTPPHPPCLQTQAGGGVFLHPSTVYDHLSLLPRPPHLPRLQTRADFHSSEANAGQRRPMKTNAGPQQANEGQRMPTEGPRHPTKANEEERKGWNGIVGRYGGIVGKYASIVGRYAGIVGTLYRDP
jgi:hypothetical protein